MKIARVLTLVLLVALPCRALINPRFTPVDLVKGSDAILKLDLRSDGKALRLTVSEALKGKAPPELTLQADESIAEVIAGIDAKGAAALLFLGKTGPGEQAEGAPPVGLLNVNRTWLGVYPGKSGGHVLGVDKQDMKAVWAGATDMLERAVRYVLAEPQSAAFPVRVNARWRSEVAVAELRDVGGLGSVDLGGGSPLLMVCSTAGDRLFAHEKGKMRDVTSDRHLGSASKKYCWADLNADGRLDLLSWDGKQLVAWLQDKDGRFAAAKEPLPVPVCHGLVAVAVGSPARAAVAAAADDGVVLITFDQRLSGGPTLTLPATMRASLGAAGPLLATDLDNDGHMDLVAVLEQGLVAWAGRPGGSFSEARRIYDGAVGKDLTAADAADLDSDGLIDLVIGGRLGSGESAGATLLANRGSWTFTSAWSEAGEVYKVQTRIRSVQVCDIDTDGRTDLMLAYERAGPVFMFNRGFRTFGTADELNLVGAELGEGAEAKPLRCGEQLGRGAPHAVVADFDGDGAPDLAFATTDGNVWVVFREAGESCLGLTVALPVDAAGPAQVTLRRGKSLPSTLLVAPGRPAHFGLTEKAGVTLTWFNAGGKLALKRHAVVDPGTRCELRE